MARPIYDRRPAPVQVQKQVTTSRSLKQGQVTFFNVGFEHETAAALLVDFRRTKHSQQHWIPLSQVIARTFNVKTQEGSITIPKWLADKLDMV